jgi:hypothetical protein
MEKRNAAGITPDELSVQDAYMEGQRAGASNIAAGLNPYKDTQSPEYQAWERGRAATVGMRLARSA